MSATDAAIYTCLLFLHLPHYAKRARILRLASLVQKRAASLWDTSLVHNARAGARTKYMNVMCELDQIKDVNVYLESAGKVTAFSVDLLKTKTNVASTLSGKFRQG
jgi:hypothetical protein